MEKQSVCRSRHRGKRVQVRGRARVRNKYERVQARERAYGKGTEGYKSGWRPAAGVRSIDSSGVRVAPCHS
jgi:hypothetical protein